MYLLANKKNKIQFSPKTELTNEFEIKTNNQNYNTFDDDSYPETQEGLIEKYFVVSTENGFLPNSASIKD